MADVLGQFQTEQEKSLKTFLQTATIDVVNIQKSAKPILDELEADQAWQKDGFNKVIAQIKSSLNLGSKPKREDFLKATKEIGEIKQTLADILENPHGFHPDLITALQAAAQVAGNAIAKKSPTIARAAATGVLEKAKQSASSFLSGTAMQMLEGVPFGNEMVGFLGAKLSGMFEKKEAFTESQLGVMGALGGRQETDDELDTDETTPPGPTDETTPPGPTDETTPPGPTDETTPPPPGGFGGDVGGILTKIEETNRLLKEGFGLNSPPYLQTLTEKLGGEVQSKPGFLMTAEDKVDERATRMEKDGGEVEEKNYDLLENIDDNLQYIRDNTESAESRRERLRGGKVGAISKAKGKDPKAAADKEGWGILDILGVGYGVKKIKDALIGIRQLFGKGLFGKNGLFRNLKVNLARHIKDIFGKKAMEGFLKFSPKAFLKGGLQFIKFPLKLIGAALGKISTSILAFAIDGIFGFMDAEKWGVSKTSGVIGGLLGGSEGGWMNAAMNAGKWAMLGFQIGKLGGPPGMIAGIIIGAAIGGILGWIGGDVIARKLDKVGAWFGEMWDTVVQGIMDAWDAVVPEWFRNIDFEWTDIFPTALIKLFKGEYFTIDFPDFHWYDIFPKFLVDWFKGTAKKVMEKPWHWTDIFPKFLRDFFSGGMADKDYKFSWWDLLPTWMVTIMKSTGEAFTETWDAASWKSMLPNWMVKVIDHDWIKPTGTFEWTDLFPNWLNKIIDAGKAAGTTETGEFDWTRLMPPWMKGAWESTVAFKETVFNWAALLPGWLSAAWGDVKATGKSMAEGTFDWRGLLPTWLHGAFDSSVAIKNKDWANYDWTQLLPDWMNAAWDLTEVNTGNKLAAFDWTRLLPDWMTAAWAATEGTRKKIGAFDWTRLLPDWMASAWGDAKELGGKAKGGIESLWEMVKEIFQGLIDKVLGLIPEKLLKIAQDPVGFAKDVANETIEDTKQLAAEGVEKAKEFGGAAVEGVSNFATGAANLAETGFDKVTGTVSNWFGGEGKARGGIIVNRPSYLPSSGTVVGEHGTWKGKGAARGAVGGPVPLDGGPEAIVPITGHRMEPIAKSIAGQIMNNLAMDKIELGGPVGMGSAPTVIDNSSQPIITNNTIINSPEPQGPMLPGAGRDHAVSHFRHVA